MKTSTLKLYLHFRNRTNLLCQGRYKRPAKLDKNCHCTHLHHGNAYLELGPFKYEKLNQIPEVGYIHQLMSDEECQYMKRTAVSG